MLPASPKWSHWLVLLAGYAGLISVHAPPGRAQEAEVIVRLIHIKSNTTRPAEKTPPAVIWLNSLHPDTTGHVTPPGNFVLLQKNKMFTPHLLVVPVGSSVAFPNADPFFHNVFSLFNGQRFDLGLYEAGSTRSVVFSREGVSYIFCNIHSEMSAVVIALATPYFGLADSQGVFHVNDVPAGDYDLHVWVEGQKQSVLDRLTRRVHIAGAVADLGYIGADSPEKRQHLNKFGRPYEPDTHPIY
jgi:plastocyanin